MTPAQTHAKTAAERLMKERKCIVVGFPATTAADIHPGTLLDNFAGTEIPGKRLEVTARCTHSDWEAQARHLGLRSDTPRDKANRFYFARLIAAPEVKA